MECVSLEDKLLEVGRSSFQRLLVRSMASNTAQALDRQWLTAAPREQHSSDKGPGPLSVSAGFYPLSHAGFPSFA